MGLVDKILKEAMEEFDGLSTKSYRYKKDGEDVGYINVDILPSRRFYSEFSDYVSKEEYERMFGSQFMMIKRIFVDNKHAGNGIGSQMMNKAFEIAKVNGCNAIVLNASPIEDERMSTDKLVNYYSKFGFKMITTNDEEAIMIKSI